MSILSWLGTGSHRRAIERFMIKLLNQKELLEATQRHDRESQRVPAVLEVRVLPWDGHQPIYEEAFFTTTRDITLSGISIVASGPFPIDAEVVLSIYVEGEYHHFLFGTRHSTRLGPESFLIGLEGIRPLPSSHQLSQGLQPRGTGR
jgi:hypothetical protein